MVKLTECKKLLNKLKLKGYVVSEGKLYPINHNTVTKVSEVKKQVIVVKLEDIKDRIK